jgi:hypothetical protein
MTIGALNKHITVRRSGYHGNNSLQMHGSLYRIAGEEIDSAHDIQTEL